MGPNRKTGARRREVGAQNFDQKISVTSTDSLQELYAFWIFFRRISINLLCARVAQLVERSTDTREVHGSNPCTRTKHGSLFF